MAFLWTAKTYSINTSVLCDHCSFPNHFRGIWCGRGCNVVGEERITVADIKARDKQHEGCFTGRKSEQAMDKYTNPFHC